MTAKGGLGHAGPPFRCWASLPTSVLMHAADNYRERSENGDDAEDIRHMLSIVAQDLAAEVDWRREENVRRGTMIYREQDAHD